MMKTTAEFNQILASYKIKAECINFTDNNSYMFFDVVLKPGGKVKDLIRFSDEISLALKVPTKPSIDVRRSEGVVRVGFAKTRKNTLGLFDLISKPNKGLTCVLGEAVDGTLISMDLAENPHMIISGSTGSGKSVLLHTIIGNVLNNGNSKVILMDPKNIEFDKYKNMRDDVYVKNTFDECVKTLMHLDALMDYRYKLISAGTSVTRLPYIVTVIDEFADIIMQDEEGKFYHHLCRLAQKCRAARMHFIIATQRPTVNIINGTIKANFPARIACRVASYIDSKVILDTKGAENLMGKGDALLKDNSRAMERFQVAYTSADEIRDRFHAQAA